MAELVYAPSYSYPAVIVARVINIVLSIVELLLAVRLVFELLGANPGAAFVAWIYSVSGSLVAPFAGAFPSFALSGGLVIDLSTILAMIAYAVLAWIVIRLIEFIFSAV